MPKNQEIILNSKTRDSSSKIIFDDPILCSQFLRDYVEDIPCLKDVLPEDIEDVSEQYVPLFAEERNADRVKRVNIKNDVPFFLVSLIEHKTKVEYNIVMQIFRYMIHIWEAFEKEAERQHKGISRQKHFKYPPILPIVYYEGKQTWTAPLNFKSRIMEGDTFSKYVPDFQYHLVPLRKYSNQELLDREDEISLIMMINRMQTEEDIAEFRRLPADKLHSILRSTPEHLMNIIADVLLTFLLKTHISADEAEEVVGRLREKNMGQLFENMDPIDIPARRRELAEQKEQLAEQKEQLAEQKEQLAEQKEQLAEQKEQLAEKQAKIEAMGRHVEERERHVEEKERYIEEKERHLERIELEKQQMQEQLNQRDSELEELRKNYEKLLREKGRL